MMTPITMRYVIQVEEVEGGTRFTVHQSETGRIALDESWSETQAGLLPFPLATLMMMARLQAGVS